MKEVESDNYKFYFTDAIDAYKFDETDKTNPHFHGAPMKAVDIIAEFKDAYIFVEMKNYDDITEYDEKNFVGKKEIKEKREKFKWLKNYLKYKYRDTYLYRYAEAKVDKPVHYICLINFDNALNSRLNKALKKELPVGKVSKRWKNELANSCQVINLDKWNKNFPKWKVTCL